MGGWRCPITARNYPMNLYKNESGYPLINAQRNLCGRTHYVDQDTLRFHKSKVMSAHVMDQGLLFGIVTSDSLNFENTKRGFRFVIFNIFGTVIARTEMENAFRTSDQARKAMFVAADAIDAKAITFAAIEREAKRHAEQISRLIEQVKAI
jgi:hypothetical protein